MKSMTGYGRASARSESIEVTVEASSVNGKKMEIFASTPKEWLGADTFIREHCRQVFQRGKISVRVQLEWLDGAQQSLLSVEEVDAVLGYLRRVSEACQVPFSCDTALLLQIAQGNKGTERSDWQEHQSTLQAALTGALTALQTMQAQEGQALQRDLQERLASLEAYYQQIVEASPDDVPAYRERLLERLRQFDLEINLDDERVLKEISLFADRCDVSEELTRLASHYKQFAANIDSATAIGRKLDFLCQEIHRELNTIGSKTHHLEVTQAVLECKNELERMREQVQNIE